MFFRYLHCKIRQKYFKGKIIWFLQSKFHAIVSLLKPFSRDDLKCLGRQFTRFTLSFTSESVWGKESREIQPCLLQCKVNKASGLKPLSDSFLCNFSSTLLSLSLLPFTFIQRFEKVCPLLLRNLEYFKDTPQAKSFISANCIHNEGVFPALSSLMALTHLSHLLFANKTCLFNSPDCQCCTPRTFQGVRLKIISPLFLGGKIESSQPGWKWQSKLHI